MKALNSSSSICIYLLTLLLLSSFSIVYAQWEKTFVDTLIPEALFLLPTVGDIEDDGDIDIVVVRMISEEPLAGEIAWYESPDWTKHVIDDDLGFVKTADVNDDRKIDIIAANMAAGEVVWYEAPSWTRHIIGTLPMALGVEVIDLDKDGDMDVVATAVTPNKIVWYEAPNWTVHTIADETIPGDPSFIVAVDIDLDSDIDVIIPIQDHGIFLYEAPAWTVHSITTSAGSGQIEVGDIDGDSDLDIARAGPGANVFWYENPAWTPHIIDADQPGAWGLVLADLDNDDKIDVIASGSESDEVAWYESHTWTKHVIDESLGGASGLAAADIDGDSLIDIVACGPEARQVVLYTSTIGTSISPDDISSEIPKSFKLYQNYPNPFNPETEIDFALPEAVRVNITVYNLLGQAIEVLVNSEVQVGYHSITWSGQNFTSGIYFYRLSAGDYTDTKRMLLVK